MTSPVQNASAPVVHLPHNVELPIIFYRNQPVITFAMMDKTHQRPEGTAGRNFRTHRGKLIQSEDFYLLEQPDEIRRVGLARSDDSTPASVILLTVTGYLMLVKSFTDDLAWQVQRQLVKGYFRTDQKASSNRITSEQYVELAGFVNKWSLYFAYEASARHAAWKLARSICGTRATEMPADKFPDVLAAFKTIDKRASEFITLRKNFEMRAIQWVFGEDAEILPEPVFPELQDTYVGRAAS